MILKLSVAAEASEIGNKVRTLTSVAPIGRSWCVLEVRMLAYAWCTPSIYIEALSSGQPVLTDFFGTPRNKLKSFAFTFRAIVFYSSIFKKGFVMKLE